MVSDEAKLNIIADLQRYFSRRICHEMYPIAAMIHWSNNKEVDKKCLTDLMGKISRTESMFSPIRRHRKYMTELIGSIFDEPIETYEKMHKHFLEGDYIAGSIFSSHVNLALINRLLEPQNTHKEIKSVIANYNQLKKVHPILVDGQIKPYLLVDKFAEVNVAKVRAYMDDFKRLGFKVCKGLLWLSLYLCSQSKHVDVFKVNALRAELESRDITVNPDDYILLGFMDSKIVEPNKALDYCQNVLPTLLDVPQINGLGEQTLLFFALNRYMMEEGYHSNDEGIYDFILVMNQLVTNNASVQGAVNAL